MRIPTELNFEREETAKRTRLSVSDLTNEESGPDFTFATIEAAIYAYPREAMKQKTKDYMTDEIVAEIERLNLEIIDDNVYIGNEDEAT